uniref:Uncharacterized protein n=1 Tax=viral metagenome TaxID=1070528 RepID=A0A6C0AWR0_9ZZZZ|tara:strand:+ start:290 stop:1069 length:780 start_codon:yes stop_codon:yes gene_type:complete
MLYLPIENEVENELENELQNIKSLLNDSKSDITSVETCDTNSEIDEKDNISEISINTTNMYDELNPSNITKNFMVWLFFLFLKVYTNIELFVKDKLSLTTKNNIDKVELINNKSEYDYYSNNKIIASSKTLTNRKNYDFALCFHDTNSNIRYVETIICHNKIKKRNTDICQKYFISVYFSINENDYQLELDNENMNFYLTNNIIDYTVINYLMLNKYNMTISNIPYNLILIDDESNVILPKDTQYIRFYKNRYIIGDYD